MKAQPQKFTLVLTMKVVLHCEDNENSILMLWILFQRAGKLDYIKLTQPTFVESYNGSDLLGKANPLAKGGYAFGCQ